jgi:hypothetical protein
MEGLRQPDPDLAGLALFSDLTASELDAVTQEFEEEQAMASSWCSRVKLTG